MSEAPGGIITAAAIRTLKTRRWIMVAGIIAGAFLAVANGRDLMRSASPHWLDVGIVVIWAFVALSSIAGYVMLTRRINRLEGS